MLEPLRAIPKPKACRAQGACDIKVITHLGARAFERLPFGNFAHDRDGDIQWACGGVAAHQITLKCARGSPQTFGKARQPIRVHRWQGQGEGELSRGCAHSGHVA